jgi:hypothetical protein
MSELQSNTKKFALLEAYLPNFKTIKSRIQPYLDI